MGAHTHVCIHVCAYIQLILSLIDSTLSGATTECLSGLSYNDKEEELHVPQEPSITLHYPIV